MYIKDRKIYIDQTDTDEELLTLLQNGFGIDINEYEENDKIVIRYDNNDNVAYLAYNFTSDMKPSYQTPYPVLSLIYMLSKVDNKHDISHLFPYES